MIRLHLRVWLSSPHAPAAGGLAAMIVAAALLAVAIAIWRGIPAVNVALVMLLPLGLGGSVVTTIMLPPRPRPVRRRAAAADAAPPDGAPAANGTPPPRRGTDRGGVPPQTPAPGRATHTVRVGGARCGQGMPRPGQRPAQLMRASSPGRDSTQPADIRLGQEPAAATPEGEAAAAGPTSPPGARPTRTLMAGRAPGNHPTNENAHRLQPAGGKGVSR